MGNTRRAADGKLLICCSRCLTYMPADQFARRDTRRGDICCVCETQEMTRQHVSDLPLAGLIGTAIPPSGKKAFVERLNRTLKLYFRKSKLPRRGNSLLRRMNSGSAELIAQNRMLFYKILRRLSASDTIWMFFRPALADDFVLRYFTLACAKYAVKLTRLGMEFPTAADIIFELQQMVMADKVEASQLFKLRHIAYRIYADVHEEFYPLGQRRAAAVLTAICLDKAYDAAVATLHWFVDMLHAEKITYREILRTLRMFIRAAVDAGWKRTEDKVKQMLTEMRNVLI